MINERETIKHCLDQIQASSLNHLELLQVAAICKDNGLSQSEFSAWFSRTKKINGFVMQQQWNSIKGSANPVGVGSLVKMCRDMGGNIDPQPFDNIPDREIGWDEAINSFDTTPVTVKQHGVQIVRQEWLQDEELPPVPGAEWTGKEDLIKYLRTIFQTEDKVGYVSESWRQEEGGRWLPKRGCFDRSAGQLLESLANAGDIGAVIGDWNKDAGAWIRFNPLDGTGCSDSNVTAYRFALVESDSIPIPRQYAIYRKLELPIAALVHSGGKSLHAIVRIDAADFKEYQKRVDFLYDVCKKNGLQIDRQNRNPSRLSRLPGVTRGDTKQWLVDTNTGKGTWKDWEDWIAAVNDDLPEVENLGALWDNLPPLAEPLIDGLLRKGHKMLLAGPSKAGKSFMLLQLAIAIAEGKTWLNWQCHQGRVLYVNLELDRPSALRRLRDVYNAIGIEPRNVASIDVWNLRGKALPMDQLAPKLIRRAMKARYAMIIIDPIYKVITGDENAADQMAKFCNMFDRVCNELGAAVVYCHHHSKGDQGQKRASDRASGSGVFARDPDALLDLIELALDETRREVIRNAWQCAALTASLDKANPSWREHCPDDCCYVASNLRRFANNYMSESDISAVVQDVDTASEATTAWRVEGILREFQGFKPRRFFFQYPIHKVDDCDLLTDAKASGELPERKHKEKETKEVKVEEKKSDKITPESMGLAIAAISVDGLAKWDDLMNYFSDAGNRKVSLALKVAGYKSVRGVITPA